MRVVTIPATIFLLLALGAPPMAAATLPAAPIDAGALKRLQAASFDADWAAVVAGSPALRTASRR